MKIFSSKLLYECFASILKNKSKQFDKFKELYFIFDENYWFSMVKHPEFIYNFTVKNQIKFKELKENISYFFEPVTKEFTYDERNKLKNQINLTSKKITKVPIFTLVHENFMCIANLSKFKSELNNVRLCSSAWGFNNLIHIFLKETEEMLFIHIRSFFDERTKKNELNIWKIQSLIENSFDLSDPNNKLLLNIYDDLNNLLNDFKDKNYWKSISKDIAHFQTTDDYKNLIENNFTINKLFNIFEEIYFYLKILAYLLFKKNMQFMSFYTRLTFEDMFCLNVICASLSIYDVYSKWIKFGANWEINSYLDEKKASKLSDLNYNELIELENKILEKIKLTNLVKDDLNLLNSNESQYHSHLLCNIREQKIIYIMNYFRQILLIKKELFSKSNNK